MWNYLLEKPYRITGYNKSKEEVRDYLVGLTADEASLLNNIQREKGAFFNIEETSLPDNIIRKFICGPIICGNFTTPYAPTTVFELKTISCSKKISATRNCNILSAGIYSSLTEAQSAIQDTCREDSVWANEFFAYIIEERVLDPIDINRTFVTYRTYDSKGNPNDACLIDDRTYNSFLGRKPEDIRFKEGDIVWALCYKALRLCIVSGLPFTTQEYKKRNQRSIEKYDRELWLDTTDDSYTLYTLGEGDTHAHVLCAHVFKPTEKIPEKLILQLKDKLKEMHELYKNE